MKKIIICLILVLILPLLLAEGIQVEKQNSNQVMVMGINQPATFELKITNNNQSDNFEFYNLLGFNMEPKEIGYIQKEGSKEIELNIYPRDDLTIKGFYTLPYFIKGVTTNTLSNQEIELKIIELKEAFEIGVEEFDMNSNEVVIYIKNKEKFNFQDIEAEFNSPFFNTKEYFSLNDLEKETFKISLDQESFSRLRAGFYTMTAEIQIEDQKAEIETTIEFKENQNLKTETKDNGILINSKKINKINQGNTIETVQITVNKNIFSRLFTSLSPEPDIVERNDLIITYIWEKQVKPGETFSVTVKTNWFFPLILIILIGVIIYLVKFYTNREVVIKKKISFVHSQKAEFALKVSILVKANSYVEKVNIIDRLPLMVKLYSKFGGQEPFRKSEEKRRIEWSFEKLEPGEVRLLSYVIYSKVGVVGKFALPKATAIYEDQGELKEAQSNQTYFMAEQVREQ
jgi:hypothetical protein